MELVQPGQPRDDRRARRDGSCACSRSTPSGRSTTSGWSTSAAGMEASSTARDLGAQPAWIVGVDVFEPSLEVARAHQPRVRYVLASAGDAVRGRFVPRRVGAHRVPARSSTIRSPGRWRRASHACCGREARCSGTTFATRTRSTVPIPAPCAARRSARLPGFDVDLRPLTLFPQLARRLGGDDRPCLSRPREA